MCQKSCAPRIRALEELSCWSKGTMMMLPSFPSPKEKKNRHIWKKFPSHTLRFDVQKLIHQWKSIVSPCPSLFSGWAVLSIWLLGEDSITSYLGLLLLFFAFFTWIVVHLVHGKYIFKEHLVYKCKHLQY